MLPQRVVFASGDSPAAGLTLVKAAAIPGNNPRTVTEDSLTALLQAAWAGEEPS